MDSSDCRRLRETEYPSGALAALSPTVARPQLWWRQFLLLQFLRPPSSHEPASPTTLRLKIARPLRPDPSLQSILAANCRAEKGGGGMARTEEFRWESPALRSQICRPRMTRTRRRRRATRPRPRE